MGMLIEQKSKWNTGNYQYGLGGKGAVDKNGDGKIEIDCSHLVNNMLRDAGYNIPYQSTGQLQASKYYDQVNFSDVKPGDIILWKGHVGVVESYDPDKGTGTFFGSQSKNGPATAKFGDRRDYWKQPIQFLRPKEEYKIPGSNQAIATTNLVDKDKSKLRANTNGYGAPGGLTAKSAESAIIATLRRDPLAFDLDGDGIETIGRDTTILFDHDGDGIKTGTGWLKSDDAWLVLDRDGNCSISCGGELFGADTLLKDGTKASDGFTALREKDNNSDGVIDAKDPVFDKLRLWRDLNQDGMSQSNELTTLTDNYIVSIDLNANSTRIALGNGNIQVAKGTFTRRNGTTSKTSDSFSIAANLELEVNTFHRQFPDNIALTEQALALPDLNGSGRVRDLREAISLSPTFGQLVERYMQESTREGQIKLLDAFIEQWANTADFKSLKQQAEAFSSSGATLTYKVGELKFGTPEYDEFIRKLGVVERFMGFTYGGESAQARFTPLGPKEGNIKITLTSTQVSDIIHAYDRFKMDIYESLLLSSRLDKYQNAVEEIEMDGIWKHDFSKTETLFANAVKKNPREGFIDLVEFISAVGPRNLDGMGWNWLEFLGSQRTRVTRLGLFTEELSAWPVHFVKPGDYDAFRDRHSGLLVNAYQPGEINFGIYIYGDNTDDILIGCNGTDFLAGEDGNDILIGGPGDDKLQGGPGNDVFDGGPGDDELHGSTGANTYLYGRGDGKDMIFRGPDNKNILKFKPGIKPEDVELKQDLYSLLISFKSKHPKDQSNVGEVMMPGYFMDNSNGSIQFSDGTEWDPPFIGSKVSIPIATEGNDALCARETDDHLDGLAGNDCLFGVGGSDHLYGGNGNDELSGGRGDDVLDGGAGDDMLYGDEGSDTYIFGRGADSDLIRNYDRTASVDVLSVNQGVSAEQLWFRSSGANLEVSIIGTSDKVTIERWYQGNAFHVDRVELANGKVLLDSQVENLVSAMAAFAPPAPGQTTLPSNYQETLSAVIAANWK